MKKNETCCSLQSYRRNSRIERRRKSLDELVNKRINEVIKGNQDAFEEIVTLFQHRLYQVCFRMLGNRQEAEDIAQEAFVRAYVNIHTYDQKRKFSTWLFRIATNLCIDRIRKKEAGLLSRCTSLSQSEITMWRTFVFDRTYEY